MLEGKVYQHIYSVWTEILFKLLACVHCESIGSFKDESCTNGYVSQLNWNWVAPNRTVFLMALNYMWNWNFSEVVILAPKVGSAILHAKELI